MREREFFFGRSFSFYLFLTFCWLLNVFYELFEDLKPITHTANKIYLIGWVCFLCRWIAVFGSIIFLSCFVLNLIQFQVRRTNRNEIDRITSLQTSVTYLTESHIQLVRWPFPTKFSVKRGFLYLSLLGCWWMTNESSSFAVTISYCYSKFTFSMSVCVFCIIYMYSLCTIVLHLAKICSNLLSIILYISNC